MGVEHFRVPMQRISYHLEKTVKGEDGPRILYLDSYRTSSWRQPRRFG